MRFVILLLAIAVTACSDAVVTGDTTSETVVPGTPTTDASGSQTPGPGGGVEALGVTLKLGEEAQVAGEPVKIAFLEILEDSRCPTDVNCVWEGNAGIRLGIQVGNEPRQSVELNTATDPRTAEHRGYVFIVARVEPQPVSTQPVPDADYRIRVTVGRS
jgi:hypothetical protein